MVPNPSPYDPWLLYGVLTNQYHLTYSSDLQYQLHFEIYVDEFVSKSSDPDKEELFKACYKSKSKWILWEKSEYFLDNVFN